MGEGSYDGKLFYANKVQAAGGVSRGGDEGPHHAHEGEAQEEGGVLDGCRAVIFFFVCRRCECLVCCCRHSVALMKMRREAVCRAVLFCVGGVSVLSAANPRYTLEGDIRGAVCMSRGALCCCFASGV